MSSRAKLRRYSIRERVSTRGVYQQEDVHQQEDVYQQEVMHQQEEDKNSDTESFDLDNEYYSDFDDDTDDDTNDDDDFDDGMDDDDDDMNNDDAMQIDNESNMPNKEIIEGLKLLHLKSLYNFTESAYDDIEDIYNK